jgi:hypothetical protein
MSRGARPALHARFPYSRKSRAQQFSHLKLALVADVPQWATSLVQALQTTRNRSSTNELGKDVEKARS